MGKHKDITNGYIISLSGKIASGKSTLARYIIENMPDMRFVEKSFAYNLKMITSIISGLPMEDMLSHEGKNKVLELYGGITVGRLQQLIGTDLFREHFDDMVWVKSLFSSFDAGNDNWIVSDVRFKNEADHIRSIGGILIRLEGDPGGLRAKSTRDMNHPSETELDDYKDFDITLHTEPDVQGERLMRATIHAIRKIMYARVTDNPQEWHYDLKLSDYPRSIDK